MATWRTPEQRIAELDRKRAQLAAQKRAALTREKVILGAAVAAEMKENHEFAARVISILRARVKREPDVRAIRSIFEAFPEAVLTEKPIPDSSAEDEKQVAAEYGFQESGNSVQAETDPFATIAAVRRVRL